jgi:hypothetical protein
MPGKAQASLALLELSRNVHFLNDFVQISKYFFKMKILTAKKLQSLIKRFCCLNI